ncbi:unnamed protein product, partial [Didymodactylos carnosus]
MEFFGRDFLRYFTNYGYDKILRVAGRHYRDFLRTIDQLHDSNRYSFPHMNSPVFHVTEEDENGAVLHYKSKRLGWETYTIGGLKECAAKLFKTDVTVRIQADESSNGTTDIIFRIDFNNRGTIKQIFYLSTLPDLTSETFFKVFPFCIVINRFMRIFLVGQGIRKLFAPPYDKVLVGQSFNDAFSLIRPDIPLQYQKILSYGRHIVFVIESKHPLRADIYRSNDVPRSTVRLKGQMKSIKNWNMIVFLCHPV